MNRTVTTIRWIARILSVLIILFWGVMIVGSFLESIRGGHPSGPLSMHDRMGLTLMFAWLLGLALAWKWELAGAALTLAAFLIEAFFINWKAHHFFTIRYPFRRNWIRRRTPTPDAPLGM